MVVYTARRDSKLLACLWEESEEDMGYFLSVVSILLPLSYFLFHRLTNDYLFSLSCFSHERYYNIGEFVECLYMYSNWREDFSCSDIFSNHFSHFPVLFSFFFYGEGGGGVI